ncbi:helix-turn-helix domain-containing protein [Fimbriiglobus ruber]|uniref:helix-turn-helix domain-containing protein n=1 Tax=Fimbriiglobus ruber TaxID=1908690 RepID=UPI000B4AB454|nr:helix-turn-helix transcriptional regulator [Fimbriiglobus ruber]
MSFGVNLKKARELQGISQSLLSRLSGVGRLVIVRTEAGESVPDINEVVALAKALKVPLSKLVNARWRPEKGLKGIGLELWRLGIRDLEVSDAEVPGSFRRKEEVLVLAVAGTRPNPRIVEAMPYVLGSNVFDPTLLLAFAKNIDPRARRRLAWLADFTLVLRGAVTPFPSTSDSGYCLEKLVSMVKKPGPKVSFDNLGYPGDAPFPVVWRRWKMSYGGRREEFVTRAGTLAAMNSVSE